MTTFGFVPSETGSTDIHTGSAPGDIGLGGKGNSFLVEQALAMSPANFIKQSSPYDLYPAGYGSGSRAGVADVVVQNYENRGGNPLTISDAASADNATNESKTLRSVLSGGAFASARNADITTSSRASDLIDLLSSPSYGFEARAKTQPQPQPYYSEAKSETGPLPVANSGEVVAPRPLTFDVKSNPLFALLNKDAKSASAYNYNARMDSTGIEALSRQIMPVDFTAPKAWAAPEATRGKNGDPFSADNCDQSMEFRHDGSVVTTTTLPDRSASKVETVNLDKSKSIALTDAQGRATVEQKFDATGHLVSQTSSRYDHTDQPMVASQKIVQTATQAIETKMNESGLVVGSKIVAAGDLSANKSLA